MNSYISDAPIDIPKYTNPDSRVEPEIIESAKTSSSTVNSQDQDIGKLRVNLFSGWGEDSTKAETNTSNRITDSRDAVVNYSTGDMSSEVEMLDSSTAHIEYN